jgi:hypothetical protein
VSTFTDSPEDLIAKALRIAKAGKVVVDEQAVPVPGAVCMLLVDMARAVELERASRSTTAEIIKQASIREGQALHELEGLRRRRLATWLVPAVLLLASVVLFVLSRHR